MPHSLWYSNGSKNKTNWNRQHKAVKMKIRCSTLSDHGLLLSKKLNNNKKNSVLNTMECTFKHTEGTHKFSGLQKSIILLFLPKYECL